MAFRLFWIGVKLLIEPIGIEMALLISIVHCLRLLIEPIGIEIVTRLKIEVTESHLLIEPIGIEMLKKTSSLSIGLSFN